MIESESSHSISAIKKCRVCGKENLEDILSLGVQKHINFLDSADQTHLEAPLEIILCNEKDGGCGLLQLRHTVPGDLLYRTFWYKSGVNQTMRDALSDITKNAENRIELKQNDIVVDIGANDGTLLRTYRTKNLKLVGFEPASNLVKDAQVETTEIINNFFNYDNFAEKFRGQKAKVITSIAMFYDLDDPNTFVSDIVKTLDDDGIWIIQMNYLTTMLENNAFDNIVHEHLEYYSLKSLEKLLERHDLVVFDVELNNINGGSIRTYIRHKHSRKFQTTERVESIREYEKKIGLDDSKPYIEFAKRIDNLKNETYNFIKNEVDNGKKVYAYGASTRGNTLLQFYGLDYKLIHAAADRNSMKWGKKMVGTNIPIISEEQARNDKPDYFLILPWYFIEEFKVREKNYLDNGGKFIMPLPNFQIVTDSKRVQN